MTREESINYLKDISNKCEGKEVDGVYLVAAVSIIEELLNKNKNLTILVEDLRDPFNKHRREPSKGTLESFAEYEEGKASKSDSVEELFKELKKDEKLSQSS